MNKRALSLILVALGIFSILSINSIDVFSIEFLITMIGIVLIVIGDTIR